MIANFFNKSKPVNVVIVVILLLLYYSVATLFIKEIEISIPVLINKFGFFFWHILLLLIVNFIINKNKLTQANSYALLLVVLLLGTFSEAMFYEEIVFSNISLLLAFRKIYSLRSGLNTKKKLFDAGFWIGISTLLYSWSVLFILLAYIAMIVYQKLSFKNLFIPLIGFIAPIFLFFTYHFYTDTMAFFESRFVFSSNLDFENYNSFKLLVPIAYLIAIVMWSIVSVTPKVVLVSNKLKMSWNVLLSQFFIAGFLVLLSPVKNGAEMLFLLFPASVIVANFLQKMESSIFKNMIIYLFVAISVGVYLL